MFRVFHDNLAARGIDFHVHFMTDSHKERPHWKYNSDDISFPHTFWKDDLSSSFSRHEQHLNPSLLTSLQKQKPDFLMLGGIWSTYTNLVASLITPRTVGIGWLEGNTITPGQTSNFAMLTKRFFLNRFEFLAVPGQEGSKYIDLILGNQQSKPNLVLLPNIVDESKFLSTNITNEETKKSLKQKLGLSINKKLAICPARLIPEKGIYEFVSHVVPSEVNEWNILIIGQGYLQKEIDHLIDKMELTDIVKIVPYFNYEQMPSLYAISDLFLLPSMNDPNPLSVVEAMFSGLPLLVSNRIGNYPEVLQEGKNGWSFDPRDSLSTKSSVGLAFNSSCQKLKEMGSSSRVFVSEFWDSYKAVDNFLNLVLAGNN
jgi:glycosyltransferase involved in cell wall biosynthesis